MNVFRFTVMRDVNTFNSELKKGMNISVECKGRNNPFLIVDDCANVVKAISKKYNTFTRNFDISIYFKMERKSNLIEKLYVVSSLEFSKEEVIVNKYAQFVEYISENGLPDYICFDCDFTEKCLLFLIKYCNNRSFELITEFEFISSDIEVIATYQKLISDFKINYK